MHLDEDDRSATRAPPNGLGAVLLVELCADQIRAALDEAGDEIGALSMSLLETARRATEVADQIGGDSSTSDPSAATCGSRSDALRQAAADASSRLQFADRLSQRISNAAANLTALATLMKSSDGPIAADSWSDFLREARGRFTMEQEREMFDAVFGNCASATVAAISTVASDDDVFLGDLAGTER